MPKLRYIGDHATEIPKGDAVMPVGPGEFVELTAKEQETDEVKALLDANLLIDAKEVKE